VFWLDTRYYHVIDYCVVLYRAKQEAVLASSMSINHQRRTLPNHAWFWLVPCRTIHDVIIVARRESSNHAVSKVGIVKLDYEEDK
jgi:hypothetical protein